MKAMTHLIVAMAFLVPLVTGCDQNEDHKRIQELQARCDALNTQVTALQTRCDTIATNIGNIAATILMRVQEHDPKKGVVNATTKGYAFLDCQAGRLLVSCAGAEPYLNGHKLKLKIGNPLNLTFSGFRLKVRYGAKPSETADSDTTSLAEWQALQKWHTTLKEQEITFTEKLAPGAWTSTEIILAPTKPEDLTYIEFQMNIDQVILFENK